MIRIGIQCRQCRSGSAFRRKTSARLIKKAVSEIITNGSVVLAEQDKVSDFSMAYNKKGYFLRAKAIKRIAAEHYEPGRQDRCYKWVWKRHIRPVYVICYNTFLKYLKCVEPGAEDGGTQLRLFE